ncbi:MAG: substrate-binding domain-containing protein [Burkholderiaceae bacterium]
MRFGTVSDPIALRLGHVLVAPAERHPQITLQLQAGLSSNLLTALQRGELDCAYAMTDLGGDGRPANPPPGRGGPGRGAAAHAGRAWHAAHAARADRPALVGTPTHCVLRRYLDALFASTGREYQEGMLADTEGSVRSMVASGLGAGIVRPDQAQQAERNGELAIWPGWRAHTWICFASPPEAQVSPAVAAVRSAVQEAWA